MPVACQHWEFEFGFTPCSLVLLCKHKQRVMGRQMHTHMHIHIQGEREKRKIFCIHFSTHIYRHSNEINWLCIIRTRKSAFLILGSVKKIIVLLYNWKPRDGPKRPVLLHILLKCMGGNCEQTFIHDTDRETVLNFFSTIPDLWWIPVWWVLCCVLIEIPLKTHAVTNHEYK